jgi:hypothetical protein
MSLLPRSNSTYDYSSSATGQYNTLLCVKGKMIGKALRLATLTIFGSTTAFGLLNDVIIGIALGSYIIDNVDWVAFQINHVLSGWTVEGLQRMIIWLMDWPAGLKLNTELAAFSVIYSYGSLITGQVRASSDFHNIFN